jgi:acetylglutamate kinase
VATVLKLGGELLEDAAAVRASAAAIVRLSEREPLVVVHGGGRSIDAELKMRGLTPRFADGLRITDGATLDSVVAVLAGRTNTLLVAAIGALGAKAVGLTGADARIGLAVKAAPLATVSGDQVDLGLVGEPRDGDVTLISDLLSLGYVPVVASVGVAADGTLLNVNADTFAAHLAAALRARRLIVAGTTAGVLDGAGATIDELTATDVERLTASGTAHSGMLAKLTACRHAKRGGVGEVAIVAGRGVEDFDTAVGTRVF